MRKIMFSVLAVAALAANVSPAALAKDASVGESGPAVTAQQMDELQGAYALPGGVTLNVSAMGGRLYASLNDRLVREVRMTGENTYASHDGVISLVFRPNGGGDQVTVTYDKNAAIAAQYRVAAREQGALWRTPNVGGESIHGSSDDRGGMLTASLR